jgi:hypothetical protein
VIFARRSYGTTDICPAGSVPSGNRSFLPRFYEGAQNSVIVARRSMGHSGHPQSSDRFRAGAGHFLAFLLRSAKIGDSCAPLVAPRPPVFHPSSLIPHPSSPVRSILRLASHSVASIFFSFLLFRIKGAKNRNAAKELHSTRQLRLKEAGVFGRRLWSQTTEPEQMAGVLAECGFCSGVLS